MNTTITDVRIAVHRSEQPFLPDKPGSGTFGVLTIATDGGVEGHTFFSGAGSVPDHAARVLAENVRGQLIGLDALDTGIVWQRLWRQERTLGSVVIGAVDVALWDIVGKVAGLPVHRMLGTAKTSLPVYISSWVHERPEDYAEEALHYRELGFTGYKLHPPVQGRTMYGRDVPVEADLAAYRAVREAVGPDMALMADSPFVYSFEEALRVGRLLEDLEYTWFEDPLPPDDIAGYERLRRHLRIPLLATEMTPGGPYNYAQWVTHQATDYLRGDVFFKGGITALTKIARTAEVFRLGFELHDGFNAIGNVAGAHVAFSAPNAGWFEVLTVQPTGVYGLDNFSYGLTEPMRIENGALHAPTGPGLGQPIDWERINAGIVATY
ncbi:enolase C-terminal domain-like protein [Pseudoclavibacter endophyticus]|nr:enolase C-terminal domain-like protein [Pseudoclavibacter endophyticus]